jgi:hypothetical protein
VRLSAAAVARGEIPASVCVRHGLPAARHVDFVVKSRPAMPRIGIEVSIVSIVARLGEYSRRVTLVRAKGWPLCDRCVRIRFAGLLLANLMFWGGLAAAAAAAIWRVAAGSPAAWLLAPFGGGLVLVLASVGPFVWGSLPRLTQTAATDDGLSIVVHDPHPRFVGGD